MRRNLPRSPVMIIGFLLFLLHRSTGLDLTIDAVVLFAGTIAVIIHGQHEFCFITQGLRDHRDGIQHQVEKSRWRHRACIGHYDNDYV